MKFFVAKLLSIFDKNAHLVRLMDSFSLCLLPKDTLKVYLNALIPLHILTLDIYQLEKLHHAKNHSLRTICEIVL